MNDLVIIIYYLFNFPQNLVLLKLNKKTFSLEIRRKSYPFIFFQFIMKNTNPSTRAHYKLTAATTPAPTLQPICGTFRSEL